MNGAERPSSCDKTEPRQEAQFTIESFANGLFFEIVRITDGASVFLQCDDASNVAEELERTSEQYTNDNVAETYFD